MTHSSTCGLRPIKRSHVANFFTPRVSPGSFAIGVAIALLVGTMASLIALGALEDVPGQQAGKVSR